MGAKRQKGATKKDEVTYFYLMKHTEKGTVQSFAQKQKAITAVTKVVRKEGGQCHLYSTRGAPFDFVSVISGVTTAAALRIVAEIEMRGAAKATLIPGIEVFEGNS